MILKYNIEVDNRVVEREINKLTDQIFKLLPYREEGEDWTLPLQTVMEELVGMQRLLIEYPGVTFSLMCKLEGLFTLEEDNDFFKFRRTIFECLSRLNEIKEEVINAR